MGGFISEHKNDFIFVLVGLALGLLSWYVFSTRADVSDNRERVDAITNQLDTTGKELQNTATGLNNVQQAVDRSTERVVRSETTIREVQTRTNNDTAILEQSTELIDNSQRIISAVRQRGASQAK